MKTVNRSEIPTPLTPYRIADVEMFLAVSGYNVVKDEPFHVCSSMCQALIGQDVVVCCECIITSYARMNIQSSVSGVSNGDKLLS